MARLRRWQGGMARALAVVAAIAPIAAAADAPPVDGVTVAAPAVAPREFRGDLARAPVALAPQRQQPRPYRPLLVPPLPPKVAPPGEPAAASAAPVAPLAAMPAPSRSFAGLSSSDLCSGVTCGGVWPPDANGDVGPNHYILAINQAYAVYDKAGALLASFSEDALWAGAGTTPCNGNAQGDPVVLYDALADRWVLSHFAFALSGGTTPASPFYQCIAASQTGDPVAGGWWLYALPMDPGGAGAPPVGTLNDYTKLGMWHDCLYLSANGFTEPGEAYAGVVYATLNRADLYGGATLRWSLGFTATSTIFSMVPSNLTGRAGFAIPPGTPNYFVSESQTVFDFEVRKLTPAADCGAGGTLGAPTHVSQVAYTVPGNNNVRQPNTTNRLDNLGDRVMQKVQYRRIGSAESLWVVHSTQGSGPNATVRPQWAQIDVSGKIVDTTPVQQQIYAPDTTLYRWMPSLAVDGQGNMAVGYSTSNATSPNFPSIAYSGRLASDPPGTLPQTETQLIAGAGSQTNNCGGAPCHRWGDYTAMSVDPADDCTFWYVNEYYGSQANGTAGNWQTRIGSFRFPSCAPPLPLAAASRKTHGAAGTFDLPLTLTPGNPTTEPRAGGDHTVVFKFDRAVVSGDAAVVAGTATPGTPAFSGAEMTVPLTGVPNAQYVTVSATNVTAAAGGGVGAASVRFGVLAGDVDASRSVTIADLIAVNAVLAQAVTLATYLRDVNLSGTLWVSDLLLVNAHLNQSLPPP